MMVADAAEIFRLLIMYVKAYLTTGRLLVQCLSVFVHYFLTSRGCTNGGLTVPIYF